MRYYHFDNQGILVREFDSDKVYGPDHDCYTTEPPHEAPSGFACCFSRKTRKWEDVEDNRGEKDERGIHKGVRCFDKKNKDEVYYCGLGPIPDELTREVPPDEPYLCDFDHTDGKWKVDPARKELDVREARNRDAMLAAKARIKAAKPDEITLEDIAIYLGLRDDANERTPVLEQQAAAKRK